MRFIEPELAAVVAARHEEQRRIADVQRRLHHDPVVHAVATVLQQVLDRRPHDRQYAILAGTAAIMAIFERTEDA